MPRLTLSSIYSFRVPPLWRMGLLVALAVFMADLFSKQAILLNSTLYVGGAITLGPFIDLVLEYNRGISFGLIPQDTWIGRLFLGVFNIIVASAILVWLYRCQEFWTSIGLSLLIGGALGNAVDRLVFGAVVDFIYFHVGSFGWYVFNLADVGIVVGIGFLLIGIWFPRQE